MENNQLAWARHEVELACKKENPEWDGKSFDYGCACYQSALKAYKSLTADGHSGTSWAITAGILRRLMAGQPLTPITEEDFKGVEPVSWSRDDESMYQCPRMPSLFKLDKNGVVTYSDNDRQVCVNIRDKKDRFSCGYGLRIVDEMFPIMLPYVPSLTPYTLYVEEFSSDPTSKEDFDTQGFLYLKTPEGQKIDINRFFALGYFVSGKDDNREISENEYERRRGARI
jgi:hypothetical protein